jgi:hypothetical protein
MQKIIEAAQVIREVSAEKGRRERSTEKTECTVDLEIVAMILFLHLNVIWQTEIVEMYVC